LAERFIKIWLVIYTYHLNFHPHGELKEIPGVTQKLIEMRQNFVNMKHSSEAYLKELREVGTTLKTQQLLTVAPQVPVDVNDVEKNSEEKELQILFAYLELL